MAFHIYNTLTRKLEPFVPLDDNRVRMYSCGPTVYNYVHIGNLRTFAFQDILRRYLKYRGYDLFHVMNITDVDDKIIRHSAETGQSIQEYTEQYAQAFEQDCKALRLQKPEKMTRATEHIEEMIAVIARLKEHGYTYESDGSTYFRIASFQDYGKLSRLDAREIKPGARVDQDEYEKDDVRDFALWKAARPGEPYWDSPFGPGRPGWHIECTAMSMKYLGESFDIHTGGVDLVFPHHENEIAQAEGATGKPFVKYWVHSEHLLVNGQKMSKSLGNFYTLRDLLAKGYAPEAIRYVLSSVPHRKQLNFTEDGLHGAMSAIERLRNFERRLEAGGFPEGRDEKASELAAEAKRRFEESLDDDLNTAQALAAVFEFARDANIHIDEGRFASENAAEARDLLAAFDSIFDVLGAEAKAEISPEEIEALIAERTQARKARNFARADEIRDQLRAKGVILEDSRAGTQWKYATS